MAEQARALARRDVPTTPQVALAALNALDHVRTDLRGLAPDAMERANAALLTLDDAVRRTLTREQTLARTSTRRRRALRQLAKALGRERVLRKSAEDRLGMQKAITQQFADICHTHRATFRSLASGGFVRFLNWRATYRAVHR